MDAQTDPWRQRQRSVLTAFRVESKKNRSQIAHDADLEYWQLVRLETGKTELLAKLIPKLALAYGTTAETMLEQLGLTTPKPYSPRAEMEASGVVPPHRVDQVEADVAGRDERDQRARAGAEIRLQGEIQASAAVAAPVVKPTRQRHIS